MSEDCHQPDGQVPAGLAGDPRAESEPGPHELAAMAKNGSAEATAVLATGTCYRHGCGLVLACPECLKERLIG